jgi:hypothetical protein
MIGRREGEPITFISTFIYGLFSYTVISYTGLNGRMISEYETRKGMEGRSHGLIWDPIPASAQDF